MTDPSEVAFFPNGISTKHSGAFIVHLLYDGSPGALDSIRVTSHPESIDATLLGVRKAGETEKTT
jgi:hypothetical protein